ncbi:MAG TPA: peptide chain release factor N(5)-glutamine methyltransferase [Opitutus sp.]|nr:peptide chain release factor N(5)-glutamine methyltransferase [Opitutus sp.]
MLTVLEIIKRTTDFLAGKGVENPRLNAEHIVGHALALRRMQLYLQFERPLTEGELERIRPLVRRRGQREPLQYVLGETDFCGLKLKTDRRALIPRPETELLVEMLAARLATSPPASILDLGTGTGALALALAKQFPTARVTGLDTSAVALELARENAAGTGLSERVIWLESDWFASVPVDRAFDLIVANPPYLGAGEVAAAQPEVRDHEPQAALVGGGPEGLADLQAIIAGAPRHLTAGGTLAVETGIAQHAQLLEAARQAGFARVGSHRDLTGRDRFIVATR